MRRPYTRYTPEQKQLVKTHYATHSNAELAELLHVTPDKVRALAKRLGVKWRAENGAPRWRPKPQPVASAWAGNSRWAST